MPGSKHTKCSACSIASRLKKSTRILTKNTVAHTTLRQRTPSLTSLQLPLKQFAKSQQALLLTATSTNSQARFSMQARQVFTIQATPTATMSRSEPLSSKKQVNRQSATGAALKPSKSNTGSVISTPKCLKPSNITLKAQVQAPSLSNRIQTSRSISQKSLSLRHACTTSRSPSLHVKKTCFDDHLGCCYHFVLWIKQQSETIAMVVILVVIVSTVDISVLVDTCPNPASSK